MSQPDGEGQPCDRSHAAHTLRREAEMLSQRRSGIGWNAQRMHAQSASVAKGRSKAHSVQPDCSLHSVPSPLASDAAGPGADASAATSRGGAGSRHAATRTTTRTRTHATRRRTATSAPLHRDSVPTREAKGRQDKLGGFGREDLGSSRGGGRPRPTRRSRPRRRAKTEAARARYRARLSPRFGSRASSSRFLASRSPDRCCLLDRDQWCARRAGAR